MYNRKILETTLLTFLFVLLCSLPGKHLMAVEKTDGTKLALEGTKLSNKEAAKLEEKLGKNPDDLSTRTMLLGYYQLKAFQSKEVRKERQKHVLWVIQNCPESEIAGTPYAMLDPVLDGKVYSQAKKLWLKQVESHKENTAIIGNAASFFYVYDKGTAEDLLKKGKTLEPQNPEWSKRLANL